MYSNATLKKLANIQAGLITGIIARGVENQHVKIMPKNTKVPCPNYGTSPVRNCVNCASCVHSCYVIKADVRFPWAPWDTYTDADGKIRRRPGSAYGHAVNSSIYETDRVRFWDEIEHAFLRMRGAYMRGWESGDFSDVYDVSRVDRFCRKEPEKTHWTYTKTWDAVNEYIDKNGRANNNIIMFSVPFGMDIETFNERHNRHGLPVFLVLPTRDAVKRSGMWACPGKCDVCLKCRRGCVVGESAACAIH